MDIPPGTALYPQPVLAAERQDPDTHPSRRCQQEQLNPKSCRCTKKMVSKAAGVVLPCPPFWPICKKTPKTTNCKAWSSSMGLGVAQREAQQAERIEQNRNFQLKGTYNNHLVQLPDHFRADQKLKHIVKGIVQMPLKH